MMDKASLITEFAIETFRLNGDLLEAGDRLVEGSGLTSARWQVLGAIAMSPVSLSVAHIARNMGLSRQAVQRVVNELENERFVAFVPNPHHARAKLVTMTGKGTQAYAAAMERQRPWAADLGARIAADEIRTALKMMRSVRERLTAKEPKVRRAGHGRNKRKG
jgi:DNA-binding MarR family transcriptional regulator